MFIFDKLVEWLAKQAFAGLIWFLNIVTDISSTTFFDLPSVSSILKMIYTISIAYFGVLILILLIQNQIAVLDGKPGILKDSIMKYLYGFIAITLAQPLTIAILKLSYQVISDLSQIIDIKTSMDADSIDVSGGFKTVMLIMVVVMAIATVIFVFQMLKRNVELLVLLISHPLYLTDLVTGDGTVYRQWMKQVVALVVTNAVAYLIFAFSFQLIIDNGGFTVENLTNITDLVNTTVSNRVMFFTGIIGLLVSATGVPKLLAVYGTSSSGGRGLSGSLMAANQGFGLVKNLGVGK